MKVVREVEVTWTGKNDSGLAAGMVNSNWSSACAGGVPSSIPGGVVRDPPAPVSRRRAPVEQRRARVHTGNWSSLSLDVYPSYSSPRRRA